MGTAVLPPRRRARSGLNLLALETFMNRAARLAHLLERREVGHGGRGQSSSQSPPPQPTSGGVARSDARQRPLANFLFLGPTGSGKTHAVEVLAEALFGNPRNLIKVDCAEFQHSHEIAKLVGSPPGYLGHRETHPILTQEALDRCQTPEAPLTLVLFDEVEKASDAFWQL